MLTTTEWNAERRSSREDGSVDSPNNNNNALSMLKSFFSINGRRRNGDADGEDVSDSDVSPRRPLPFLSTIANSVVFRCSKCLWSYGLSSEASIGVSHIAILRCSEASASSLHWKAFFVSKAVRGLEMLQDLRYS